ncbi:HEAT repeat domain-containing protein [Crocosphaera sp.]|uniref:HEAT repeat domain-containing protein n=1 Tax=Crocosphaera sp. TaxID=2729996 RepID=UPI0026167916|nr:HEAT repeat domain-containing protein [Crocosphaera sp.]MDJ0581566.1 HEAT repeat domain-containing protein [Crocosphaera sp.]
MDNITSEFTLSETTETPSLTVEQAIANLQQKEDLSDRYYAAWWLGRFRVREPLVIDALLNALEDEDARSADGSYPLKRNAARALGKLGDLRALSPLINCLECSDFYVRETAAQALEMLGDKTCIPQLIKLLNGGIEAAIQVPGKPHLSQPYEAIIEALGSLGASEAIPLIEPFLNYSVAKVKYAAARAMYQLTNDSTYANVLIQELQNDSLQLRRSALIDLGKIGYYAAAKPIAETLAENSLKLIAIKEILEYQLNNQLMEPLSDQSIQLMKLMDGLL